MTYFFLGIKFCSSHILHFLSCFFYISICITFLLYYSSLFTSLTVLKHSFTCFHIRLNSLSNIFNSNFKSSPSNYTVLLFVCIVNIISSLKSDSHLPKNCTICFIESPSKMMKNTFNFISKALFVLKIFNFCHHFLVMQEKRLD